MKRKFSPGDNVAYKPRRSPSIEMRETKVVGFDSVRKFGFKKQYCHIAKEKRHRRIDNSRKENMYVIEHFFGWRPSVQANLNPDLNLDMDRRYYFAFESELSLNRDK